MRTQRSDVHAATLVFLGGFAGSALRELTSLSAAGQAHPLRTFFLINALGALALGALLEWLAVRDSPEGTLRPVRLFFGVGLCGGFTTYSTFAVQGAELVARGDYIRAAGYASATLILGAAATVVGIIATGAVRRGIRGA